VSRSAQDAVREQLVAVAVGERPRRRRRTTVAIALVAVLLGATAVAEATRLLAVGEPIETLVPAEEAESFARYRAPHGIIVVVTAPDPDHRYDWGVGVYTTAAGKDCAIAGHVLGTRLGRERDGRFHPYGPKVTGACGDLDRLPQLLDQLTIGGPHPRTLLFGRTKRAELAFMHRGERRSARAGRGGAILLVLEGKVAPGELKLVE
jgi:hypothetical protein